MSVLAILLVPFYCLVKEEQMLVTVNEWFTKILYLPMCLFFGVVFMCCNLVMLPFAYFGALFKKVRLLKKRE